MMRPMREIRWERYRRPTPEELDATGFDADADFWVCAECLSEGRSLSIYREDGLLWHDYDHAAQYANEEPRGDDE